MRISDTYNPIVEPSAIPPFMASIILPEGELDGEYTKWVLPRDLGVVWTARNGMVMVNRETYLTPNQARQYAERLYAAAAVSDGILE